jgi:lipid II:glycine glycyltransferase (peptidoglycan interpeptide bridge formation enzyme)
MTVDSAAVQARVLSEADRARYDAFAARSGLADVLNSWAWGEVKRESGWTPRRIALEQDGDIVAAAQLLQTRPVKGSPPILYCPRGPVLDYRQPTLLRRLADEIKARAGSAIFLKCDPAIELDSPEALTLREAGFRPAGGGGFGGVQPTAVMVLDLSLGLEKVQEGFHKKWRYNIRLAEKKGVTVRAAGIDDLGVFYDLLLETAKRDGFLVRGRDYFRTLHDRLGDQFQMFLTMYEGRAIAGAIMLCFGPRATYTYGASSNEHRNVMPNHLMQWEMIQWAHGRGYQIYDFRGVSPVRDGKPVEEHIAGLNRFKDGFGAKYVEYAGEHDLPLRPLMYKGWTIGAPIAMAALKKLRGQSGSLAE